MIEILSLPDELLLRIFSYLKVKDLCTCSLVSKKFRDISEDDTLWKELCRITWKGKYLMNFELFYKGDFSRSLFKELQSIRNEKDTQSKKHRFS